MRKFGPLSLSATEVKEHCDWLNRKLRGAALQEIRQPDRDTLVLSFRMPGENVQLLLATGAGRSRLHTITRAPANPKRSHAFQGLLRKELRGCLSQLEHITADRIVLLHMQRGDGANRTLVAELTDRHGNFFLLDERGGILGSATAPNSGTRPLTRGQQWAPPPVHEPRDRDRFSALPAVERDLEVRKHYETGEELSQLQSRQQVLRKLLSSRLRTLRRTAKKQSAEADRGQQAGQLRKEAELLQANFHALRRGMERLEVDDYHCDPPTKVCIDLEPSLHPGEQIDRRYQRAKRAERSGRTARQRLDKTQSEMAHLSSLREACDSSDSQGALAALEEQFPAGLLARLRAPAKGPSSSRSTTRSRLPYLSYRDSKGREYRVGRGARENDELTFRHARGNDVWLHVRGRPGAHVVICQPGPSPSTEMLLLGAQLALAHSGLKEGAREEVSWTRVKEVRKSKGMPPGKVLVRTEKVLYVEAKRAELDCLQRA